MIAYISRRCALERAGPIGMLELPALSSEGNTYWKAEHKLTEQISMNKWSHGVLSCRLAACDVPTYWTHNPAAHA